MSNFSISSPVDFESSSFVKQSNMISHAHDVDNFYAMSNDDKSFVSNEKTDYSKEKISFEISSPNQLVTINIRPKSGLVYPR